MSKYFTPLKCRYIEPWRYMQEGWSPNDGTDRWELLDDFEFYSKVLKRSVKVASGFRFDKASVPTLPVIYAMFGGRYTRAAAGHDWLCREGYVRREVADKVFLELMRYENEEEIAAMMEAHADPEVVIKHAEDLESRAKAMYTGVKLYSKTLATTASTWSEPST